MEARMKPRVAPHRFREDTPLATIHLDQPWQTRSYKVLGMMPLTLCSCVSLLGLLLFWGIIMGFFMPAEMFPELTMVIGGITMALRSIPAPGAGGWHIKPKPCALRDLASGLFPPVPTRLRRQQRGDRNSPGAMQLICPLLHSIGPLGIPKTPCVTTGFGSHSGCDDVRQPPGCPQRAQERLLFSGAFGVLELERRPRRQREERFAWDAADVFLLERLRDALKAQPASEPRSLAERSEGDQEAGPGSGPSSEAGELGAKEPLFLVVDDRFGALTLSLLLLLRSFKTRESSNASSAVITVLTDSAVSWRAIQENACRNGLEEELRKHVQRQGSSDPLAFGFGVPSFVLLRLPLKSNERLAQLTWSLARHVITAGSERPLVLVGVMRAQLSSGQVKLLRKMLGEPVPSKTIRKAQVLQIRWSIPPSAEALECLPLPPKEEPHSYEVPQYGLKLSAGPGVFSAARLDQGTSFLLTHLDRLIEEAPILSSILKKKALPRRGFPRVLDLGCGNGVLGCALAKRLARGYFHFLDEDAQAVRSAEQNWYLNFEPTGPCDSDDLGDLLSSTFSWEDGSLLATPALPRQEFDVILLNPPFHQGQNTDDALAKALFQTAAKSLSDEGGQLWVVCNNHLPHQRMLKRLFSRCDRVSDGPQFIVLRAEGARARRKRSSPGPAEEKSPESIESKEALS